MRPNFDRRICLPLAIAFLAITPSLALAREQAEGSVAEGVAVPAVGDLEARLAGSSAQRDTAIRYIFEHPDAVPPIDFIYVVKGLLERGDSAQAAFWYYFWQIR